MERNSPKPYNDLQIQILHFLQDLDAAAKEFVMGMNIQCTNIILYCQKWKETVAFYQNVLHLTVTFSNDWFVEFRLNDASRVSIADEQRASIKTSQGKGITISLNVEDSRRLHADMTAGKVNPSPLKTVWKSRQFYIHDPEGNRIEFWS